MKINKNLKILIVDDSKVDALLLRSMLDEMTDWVNVPFVVASVGDMQIAVKEQDFDIVFLDLNLADSKGFDTVDAVIRTDFSGIVIIITAEMDERFLEKVLMHGVSDYLIKGQYNVFSLRKSIFYSILFQQKEMQLRTKIDEIEDISEKRRYSESRFRLLYNTLTIGVFIIDQDGRCSQVNGAYEKILEISLQEGYTKKWFDWVAPKFKNIILKKWDNVLKTREKIFAEIPVVTGKGNRKYVSLNVSALISDEGVQFVGTIEDITERKIYEHKLAESEKRFRTLISNVPVGIFRNTPGKAGRFVTANITMAKMFGFDSVDELMSCNVSELYFDSEARKIYSDKLVSLGQVVREELRLKRKDGTFLWGAVTANVIKDKDGNVIYFDGVVEDITVRKKAEAERVTLEKELNQAHKLEAIGTLAAGVAHEINTPIQFVANNTGFLSKAVDKLIQLIQDYRRLLVSCDPGEKTKKALEAAREFEIKAKLAFLEEEIPSALAQTKDGADRVAKIVNAMKDFSHMGTEEMQEEDINKAVESTVTISKNEWKYVAEMKMNLNGNIPMVECFIGDIKQVILNLIVNASHAIKDVLNSGVEGLGTIEISTDFTGKSVFIKVRDTGAGIPDNVKDKVFDHFFTTKEVGTGTGQGLSMAYQTIVEKHKGKISFETRVGEGTVFIVELPISQNNV